MENGWIKLHRKILDNPIVMKDAEHLAVWVFLLLNVTHEEKMVWFNGEKVKLQPGQMVTSRKLIADELKINETKVRRILDCFESDQQIDQQKTNRNRLISIKKWTEHQKVVQLNDQQVTNKRPTSDQQVTNNTRMKECKNNNKYIYSDSPDLNEAILNFIEYRKKAHKPMTDNAIKLLLAKLAKLTPNTKEQIEILNQSILNGWSGIFPLKKVDEVKGTPPKKSSFVQDEQSDIDFEALTKKIFVN